MRARSSQYPARATQLAVAILASALLAACAATSGAAPTAEPSTAAAAQETATPPTHATPAVSKAPSIDGPVDYAVWVERQGFGGSSGLRQVMKEAEWIRDHAFVATLYDVEDTTKHADRLASWLDEHPPTACWTEYHATVRATLGRLLDAYAAARDARATGRGIPLEVGETLVAEAQSAFDLPAPLGC